MISLFPIPKRIFEVLCITMVFSNVLLGLNPSRTYKETPEKYKLKYQSHTVKIGSGSINMWYFPSTHNSKQLIIVSHNGAGNMGDYLHRIKDLVSFGFNVAAYDYRGFGTSSSIEIDQEVYIYGDFYKDFDAVYDYCLENFAHEIHLYGWGIGAGISISRGYIRPETNVIVADTPFINLEDMPAKFASISSRMTVPFDELSSYRDPDETLALKSNDQFRGILFITGSNNLLFEAAEIESLSTINSEIKTELYMVDNPSGTDNYRVDRSRYIRKIFTFMVNS